jgi:hypothetical protein
MGCWAGCRQVKGRVEKIDSKKSGRKKTAGLAGGFQDLVWFA